MVGGGKVLGSYAAARRLRLGQRIAHMAVGAMLMYALLLSTSHVSPSRMHTTSQSANLSPAHDFVHGGSRLADPTVWPFSLNPVTNCPNLNPGAKLTVDDIAFGILTSERFLQTRLQSQQRTWLRHVRHVVFYSETDLAWVPTVGIRPPPREQLVGGGAWKNFPALLDLYRRFPTKPWVFFNDDDTYVFVRNLLKTLGNYDHDREHYIGLYWTPRVDMEWKQVKIAYASGGAGFALSRRMLERLAPVMPACQRNYTAWAGDLRVGKCIYDLGVRITPEVGFHHEGHDRYVWDSTGGGFPYGHLTDRASAAFSAPISFHHLNVDQLAMYDRMQFVDERGPRGELYRYDFSSVLLKEFIAEEPRLRIKFRLLFGVSLEVADASSGSNAQWRKDFADPLYIRRVADAADGGRAHFEMAIAKVPEIFNGDGCDAAITDSFRQPLRRTAIIEIHCQPCRRLGAPSSAPASVGNICSVWRSDECTFRVALALRCPPRQLAYAPHLDVGTAHGSADLISAGMPLVCTSSKGTAASIGAASPVLPQAATLWVQLTHGELAMAPAVVATNDEGCVARILGGKGVLVVGGTLHVAMGPAPLQVACECAGAARSATVQLTLRLRDWTSPVATYRQWCAPRVVK